MRSEARLRASDADRDGVTERLRKAAGEGRLRTAELEERLELALSATTYGELDVLTVDLPDTRKRRRERRHRRGLLLLRGFGIAFGVLVALAAVASVALAVAGVFAAWWVWLLVGWLLLRRRGRWGGRHRGPRGRHRGDGWGGSPRGGRWDRGYGRGKSHWEASIDQ